jgi:hypothetical protein
MIFGTAVFARDAQPLRAGVEGSLFYWFSLRSSRLGRFKMGMTPFSTNMKKLLPLMPLLLLLNGCLFMPLLTSGGGLEKTAEVETPTEAEPPTIAEPGDYFTTVMAWSEHKGFTPETKSVVVQVEIENGETHQVNFNGYFSPYMAKIEYTPAKSSSTKFRGVTSYGFEEREWIDAVDKTEIFTNSPFEKGEARSLTLVFFDVPKKAKPVNIVLPTHDGSIDLALSPEKILK